MKRKRLAAIASILTLTAGVLSGCGAASFDDMAGTYKCTKVIVNVHGIKAGYKSSEVENALLGSEVKITSDGKLEMLGTSYDLEEPKKSDNSGWSSVYIVGNGYTGPDTSPDYDFGGPMYFCYVPEGKQVAADVKASSDYLEMYYTPAGTSEWYFAFEYY